MALVAIVGRPNVGKSTLFNRLTKSRRAIVSEEAGTTRDRQYGKCEWNGKEFSVVDTGGWVVNSDDIFEEEIRKQVMVATEEADMVLFLVDAQNGLTDWDEDVAAILRRSKLPVILVVNKVDNNNQYYDAYEFYKLGLGDPQCISSASGSGTGDLLDLVLEKLQGVKDEDDIEDGIPRFAVVGRPNAGKSSIINAFIGEDRHIVTDIAGTTRDSIYTRYDKFGFDFYLVDTAGIRRKNKVSEDLEFYSVMRSIRAIENSDVCILMIDATRGIETQDMNIFQLIQKNQKSLVVVVNKWDLVEDKSQTAVKFFEEAIRKRMAPFTDFPVISGIFFTTNGTKTASPLSSSRSRNSFSYPVGTGSPSRTSSLTKRNSSFAGFFSAPTISELLSNEIPGNCTSIPPRPRGRTSGSATPSASIRPEITSMAFCTIRRHSSSDFFSSNCGRMFSENATPPFKSKPCLKTLRDC